MVDPGFPYFGFFGLVAPAAAAPCCRARGVHLVAAGAVPLVDAGVAGSALRELMAPLTVGAGELRGRLGLVRVVAQSAAGQLAVAMVFRDGRRGLRVGEALAPIGIGDAAMAAATVLAGGGAVGAAPGQEVVTAQTGELRHGRLVDGHLAVTFAAGSLVRTKVMRGSVVTAHTGDLGQAGRVNLVSLGVTNLRCLCLAADVAPAAPGRRGRAVRGRRVVDPDELLDGAPEAWLVAGLTG